MTPSRAIARSNRGMIASPHVAASAAGLEMLKNGGNAVDAAIAANAVLAVVYPASCGLGGDLFALLYKPKSELFAFNGSGRAPKELDARSLRARGMTSMPNRGALAVTVPGAVRAWADLALAHGTLALDDLLRPQIQAADAGDGLRLQKPSRVFVVDLGGHLVVINCWF